MTVNYRFNNGGNVVDFDDVFVRKDLFTTGGLWLWGQNAYTGVLGNNTFGAGTNKSSPVQTIAAGSNWKLVAAGSYFAQAIKNDGTLWLWGNNNAGELGDNTVTRKSSPVQTISSGTNWKLVAGGDQHTVAIKTNGTLWLWGNNGFGQLGDNTVTRKSSPVQTVAGGANWKQVACSLTTTAAIKTDGTLWLWGDNGRGQIGNNTVTHQSSPVQTVAGGTNWKQTGGGRQQTTAIKTDGTLWLWGYNAYGALGNNTQTNQSSPIQTISGGTNWKQVSGGLGISTAAIKTDGTLWLWGQNFYGSLGDGTITSKSSPVQSAAGGTNWKQVFTGFRNTAAIKTDGTLWGWGVNNYGEVGDNTTGAKSSPVQTVAGGTNWKFVASGKYHTAAIREDFY